MNIDEQTFGTYRIIHLDLKKCPPKVEYISEVFKYIRKCGGNGVLIEWEDTFPYDDELILIGSLNPAKTNKLYSPAQVTDIINLATENQLEVIPLIQTLGHLEFVLKFGQFAGLREVVNYNSSMCPSQPQSLPLIQSIINQMMKLHPLVKFLHIGGDEVWHMKKCEACKNHSQERLYLGHISKVLQFIQLFYPNVQPIMWDDMLRQIDIDIIKEYNIGSYVEPVIWNYKSSATFDLTDDLFDKYSKVFNTFWAASAYKGATSSCQILPIIDAHADNTKKWFDVVAASHWKFHSFRGIIMTGWSRYDHYAILCELLPTAVPSLAFCLRVWITGKYDDETKHYVANMLGYVDSSSFILNPYTLADSHPINEVLPCFPGVNLLLAVQKVFDIRKMHNGLMYGDQTMTWLNPWAVKYNNISYMQVKPVLQFSKKVLKRLKWVKEEILYQMGAIYPSDIVDEWIGCYIEPMISNITSQVKTAEDQISIALQNF